MLYLCIATQETDRVMEIRNKQDLRRSHWCSNFTASFSNLADATDNFRVPSWCLLQDVNFFLVFKLAYLLQYNSYVLSDSAYCICKLSPPYNQITQIQLFLQSVISFPFNQVTVVTKVAASLKHVRDHTCQMTHISQSVSNIYIHQVIQTTTAKGSPVQRSSKPIPVFDCNRQAIVLSSTIIQLEPSHAVLNLNAYLSRYFDKASS